MGNIPWRRTWQPTPVFLPGKSHGQSSLAGPVHRVNKESDTTEATEHVCMHKFTCTKVNKDTLWTGVHFTHQISALSTTLLCPRHPVCGCSRHRRFGSRRWGSERTEVTKFRRFSCESSYETETDSDMVNGLVVAKGVKEGWSGKLGLADVSFYI